VHYHEHDPGPALAPYITCVWTLHGMAAPDDPAQRVLPDGNPEIVLNLADPFRRTEDDGRSYLQPRALFVGQMRRHIVIEPTGHVDLLGIRFRPHGAAAILSIDMREVTDRIADLADVARRKTPRLLEIAGNAEDEKTRLRAVGCVLTSMLRREPDATTAAAVGLIHGSGGAAPIEAIARHTGLSLRQLERRFRRSVGLSPKMLARITRLQAVVRNAEQSKSEGWAALATRCGYADQAHFVREFREFSGQTPSAFFRGDFRFADFFAGA
jgi:AraC-like DNA-binding protein